MTIVRFTNRKAREAVYAARRNLRNLSEKVFINEDLDKKTADLFRQARLLIKAKRLHSAWTTSCIVYVKENSDPNCKARKIQNTTDLPTLADSAQR